MQNRVRITDNHNIVAQNSQRMKFNKTETEYNMKSIRFLLLTITTMFLIIASLMIVMGISVYSHYHDFSFFFDSGKHGVFFTPSILCVFLGVLMLVITSFGFFGSLKRSTCMVNLYALLLIMVLIIKLVAVILSFTMNESISNHFQIPIKQYVEDVEIQTEIDEMQVSLNCCGSSSYLDYEGLEFNANHSTVTFRDRVEDTIQSMVLPQTCCLHALDGGCTRLRPYSCKDALANFLVQHSTVLGVLGVSVMFIQILGITFALLLARCIRKLKSEMTLESWRLREQVIMQRQANEKNCDEAYSSHSNPNTSVA